MSKERIIRRGVLIFFMDSEMWMDDDWCDYCKEFVYSLNLHVDGKVITVCTKCLDDGMKGYNVVRDT